MKRSFASTVDQEQCQDIFKCVEASRLPKRLKTPSTINSKIAHFSTGCWKQCSSAHCTELISTLQSDHDTIPNHLTCARSCICKSTWKRLSDADLGIIDTWQRFGYGFRRVAKFDSKPECQDIYLCAECMKDARVGKHCQWCKQTELLHDDLKMPNTCSHLLVQSDDELSTAVQCYCIPNGFGSICDGKGCLNVACGYCERESDGSEVSRCVFCQRHYCYECVAFSEGQLGPMGKHICQTCFDNGETKLPFSCGNCLRTAWSYVHCIDCQESRCAECFDAENPDAYCVKSNHQTRTVNVK